MNRAGVVAGGRRNDEAPGVDPRPRPAADTSTTNDPRVAPASGELDDVLTPRVAPDAPHRLAAGRRRVVDDVDRARATWLRALAAGYVDVRGDGDDGGTGSACWPWTAGTNGDGYGRVWHPRSDGTSAHARAHARAHVIAWVATTGALVPEGLVLDHLCRNRSCCRPDHLRVTSQRTNTLAGAGPTADQARRTKCPRGHELTGDNVAADQLARGRRACRACHSAMNAVWNAARAGRPYTDPAAAREVLATAYAEHYLEGGPRPVLPTYPAAWPAATLHLAPEPVVADPPAATVVEPNGQLALVLEERAS